MKDTPRKVVGYRTPAQMVGFEFLAQNCENHFMACELWLRRCVSNGVAKAVGLFPFVGLYFRRCVSTEGSVAERAIIVYWNNKITFEFLIQNCKNIMNGLGGLVCCCVDWAAWSSSFFKWLSNYQSPKRKN